MRGKTRTIATVDTCAPKGTEYEVTNERKVTLRFPQVIPSYYGTGRSDFVRQLSPEEARGIGQALIDAANEVEDGA